MQLRAPSSPKGAPQHQHVLTVQHRVRHHRAFCSEQDFQRYGGLLTLLSELLEGKRLVGDAVGTAPHPVTSLASGGLACRWQGGGWFCLLPGPSCPRSLPSPSISAFGGLPRGGAGRVHVSPWRAPVAMGLCGAALLPAGSDLAAATGRAGLRVQCRRQVIIRSGALQEGAGKKEPGGRRAGEVHNGWACGFVACGANRCCLPPLNQCLSNLRSSSTALV